ncbi:MAG: type VI secretion system protein TssA [Comamonadaceae bacterium]|nr:MAG: type VI secretion system protein TssA [Comamonadaceae bacterium]
MLTPQLVDALLIPIGDDQPCGEDLEYDAAFMALIAAAEGKAEQQFGDTVIPAVEPDWRQVAEQADAVLRRSKDVRAAVLMLRAATRLQGIEGFDAGMRLLNGLLERFWDGIHPKLDADDDNDPTMRLNALAPLADERMVARDVYDALIGTAPGVGPLRVRDIAIAGNLLGATAADPGYTTAQVQGALESIQRLRPDALSAAVAARDQLARLRSLLTQHTSDGASVDLTRLSGIAQMLQKAAGSAGGTAAAQPAGDAAPLEEAAPTALSASPGGAPAARTAPGEIRNRQDALQMLDRVIHYLEQSEPGNPAPLLIQRAKKLIGVSFLEIMANLAPNALDTIETVMGKPDSPAG